MSVPCVGPVATLAVRGSASASVSFPSTPGAATVSATSSFVEYESLFTTGLWFDPEPVTVTVASSLEDSWVSLTVRRTT